MIRKPNKKSHVVHTPFVRAGYKKCGGNTMPLTTYGPSRTFHSSPSSRHHMLSSAVADTNLPSISNLKSGLNTVSPGMKQRVPPGMIDNGAVFELPDGISDLDGMAKIVQPNTITSGVSGCFDDYFNSPHLSSHTEHSFITSQYPSSVPDWYGPASSSTYSSTPMRHVEFPPSASSNSRSKSHPTRPPTSLSIKSATTVNSRKSPPSNLSQSHRRGSSSPVSAPRSLRPRLCRKTKKKSRQSTKPEIEIDTPLVVPNPLSQMSFCDPASAASSVSTIPAFTGPVTTPRSRSNIYHSPSHAHVGSPDSDVHKSTLPPIHPSSMYGASKESAIDILSSSDEEEGECAEGEDMPEMVDRCHNRYDSSSDDDDECSESVMNCTTNRESPSVPVESFFGEGNPEDGAEDRLQFDSNNSTFHTNRPHSYSKHKSRRRKKSRTRSFDVGLPQVDVSCPTIGGVIGKKQSTISSNMNPSDPPEYHSAGSKIWSSSLCPKGICLVIQTDSEVHLIQDCVPGQVYVFRQLTSIVHQQQVRSKLASFLKDGFRHDFPVLLYRNHRDHISSFCVILNNTNSISPIIDRIEFNKINRILVEVDPHNGIGCLRQAERSSLSYGFASSRCMRRGDKGTAVPSLLKNTSEPFIEDLFVTMSSIFGLEFLPCWAKYIPEADRLQFAESIAKGNLLEGLTIHLTNYVNLLQPHKDVHNPAYCPKSQLSLVVGASRWVDGNRTGATGYFRKSVTESIARSDTTAPLLEELTAVYSGLPPQRRHLTPELFEVAHKDGCHIDKNHFTVPCNIDPMGKWLFSEIIRVLRT